jgi:hypothetical protein
MPLPEFTRKLVETKLTKYCEQRIPPHVRDQVRLNYRIRGNLVTLFEERTVYKQPSKCVEIFIAQFRFNPQDKKWSLYCADRNSRWHLYGLLSPSADFDELLKEVDRDPTGIFYG